MSPSPVRHDLLIRAARGETTERTPVWLMRQAGRFDPAYVSLREEAGLPLEDLFQHPELAAEITMLPKRFGVDALILFQDILTPLTPMGAPFQFRPGPVLERPIRSSRDIERLRDIEPGEELRFVIEAIELVKRELAGEMPLLGFAGAPLTLAAFLIEGRSFADSLAHTRRMMAEEPQLMHMLLDRLASMTARYLRMKVDAGVDMVQLFESVGDLLSEDEYRAFAHPYHQQIFSQLGDVVPRCLFVKESPLLDLMLESGADVLSVGGSVDLGQAITRWGDHVAFQGNVDNRLLAKGSTEEVADAVRRCVRAGGHRGHILNLNHGLLQDTPVENVQCLIDTCRGIHAYDPEAAEARL